MTPLEFIKTAYADVQTLTDEGDQMHRRAARGKPLVAHLHAWDKTACPRPAPGGMIELTGGRAVTMRIQGQFRNVGERVTFETTHEATAFCDTVNDLLRTMAPPIPAGEQR